jgi:hypothetical protein
LIRLKIGGALGEGEGRVIAAGGRVVVDADATVLDGLIGTADGDGDAAEGVGVGSSGGTTASDASGDRSAGGPASGGTLGGRCRVGVCGTFNTTNPMTAVVMAATTVAMPIRAPLDARRGDDATSAAGRT